MANFEAFCWNFSPSTNPEIGRSDYAADFLKYMRTHFIPDALATIRGISRIHSAYPISIIFSNAQI